MLVPGLGLQTVNPVSSPCPKQKPLSFLVPTLGMAPPFALPARPPTPRSHQVVLKARSLSNVQGFGDQTVLV